MGNQNSRAATAQSPTGSTASASSNNVTATASHGSAAQHERPHVPHIYPSARRRESIQALTVKAQAAPPSASLENANAESQSHPTLSRPLSRRRSQTLAANSTTAQLASTLYSTTTAAAPAMGNEQSSQKGHHRDKDRDKPHGHHHLSQQPSRESTPPIAVAVATPPPLLPTPPPPQSQSQSPLPQHLKQTQPLDVPAPAREEPTAIDPGDASQDYIVPSSHFSRPPRLPLPIEEEFHNPGSPILSPRDVSSPLDPGEVEGAIPRRSSMLSTTTADDDDLGDEFKGPNTGRPTVPTLIEWEGPGERVYVTGTFAGWDRKFRLHKNGPSKKKDALSAYVPITPGTHHLMFLVDNDMRTSDHLPTAVDYTNILVNYLEVSYDDIPQPETDASQRKESLDAATPVQEREAPPGVYPPQVLPPTPELQPIKAPAPEPTTVPEPTKKYHQNIPRFLLDLDGPEESSRFARANAMTSNLPTPPSLPGFLGKSILNGMTPTKDDSSVLIHPNHTVLNHLATSSIKDNILATSATTRYKQKFLTTIMYKPKEEDPDRLY